nr:PREDICTED: coiled-coil domain-containing protein 83 [Latimeria chalumnae]|eukprot:XP_014343425.1 PREDICTED: coiled-coil domain-containing protein 83 [Latimeria chalumnae]
MEVSVQKLEQENLELISLLFDCRLEDLKISRNIFLTQVVGLDDTKTGLLKDNFANSQLSNQSAPRLSKPQSATLREVEKKVFSMISELESEEVEHSEQEEVPVVSVSKDLSFLLYGDQEDFQEYVQLGPLELKLLSIVGRTMPIYTVELAQEQGTEYDETFPNQKTDKWPVTVPVIKSLFS